MSDETRTGKFEKASPRPWAIDRDGDMTIIRAMGETEDGILDEVVARIEPWDQEVDEADATLIVQAVNAFEPMREAIQKCAAALVPLTEYPARVGIFREDDRARIKAAVAALSASASEDPRDATIRDLRAALDRLAEWPDSTPEQPSITRQDEAMRAFARAALRTAGVEPKP